MFFGLAQKWSILVNVHVSLIRMCILQLLNGVFFPGAFSCSFIWDMFLSLPNLAASLSLFLCIREICYVSLSWLGGLM